MSLPKRYNARTMEPQLEEFWETSGVYRFSPGHSVAPRGRDQSHIPCGRRLEEPGTERTAGPALSEHGTPTQAEGPVYSIDTPPATVSGHLHMGHVYSYSQPDFLARFWRMNGHNVFYPMGYDDNGLPTGRLAERLTGLSAAEIGRKAFTERCLAIGKEFGAEYEALWKRLGLSVDWRHTYRTIDERSQRISQLSFIDLYHKGLIERRKAPTIWCSECGTAIAQADLDDLERESSFYTLAFRLEDGTTLPIATTRPELLPACVAAFVYPGDERFQSLVGQQLTVPLFGQSVPLLEDPGADPEKGTGVVMCCTFGDMADVGWWYTYHLPLVEVLNAEGRLTDLAGDLSGLPVPEARRQIVRALEEQGLLLAEQPTTQSIRVHERCDTPVEYIMTPQWFLRVLDYKEDLLQAGDQIAWYPPHMAARYRQWVENLGWDWCLSRQRAFGVPFPVWYCQECGRVVLAARDELPVNPTEREPGMPCACGSKAFTPEYDVMDTWATSSMTPQIAGQWLTDPTLYKEVFPMSLRPQAHEIIRTWAFYTIVKSYHHFGTVPWREIAISGWGIAGEGMGKISKSRGGGPTVGASMAPMDVIERHSADAVRYWAASTSLGKDAVISETKIQMGTKLVNKLWNVARFSQRFLLDYKQEGADTGHPAGKEHPLLSPADRWILSKAQQLVRRTTELMHSYDYAAAKSEIESFFWTELADNYLEMAKLRLYDEAHMTREGAQFALYHTLLTVIKLFAPFLPHVTEQIYLGLFATKEKDKSIHISSWPVIDPRLEDQASEAVGEALVEIATAVRRFKSEHSLPLSTALEQLQLSIREPALLESLRDAKADLASITRAREITFSSRDPDPELEIIKADGSLAVALAR